MPRFLFWANTLLAAFSLLSISGYPSSECPTPTTQEAFSYGIFITIVILLLAANSWHFIMHEND